MSLPNSTQNKHDLHKPQFEFNLGFFLLAIIACGGMATMPLWGKLLYFLVPYADPILIIVTFMILTIPGVYALFRIYLPIPLATWLRGLRVGKRESNLDAIRKNIRVKQKKEEEKVKEQKKFLEEQRKARIKEKGLSAVEQEERLKIRRISKHRYRTGAPIAAVPTKKKKRRNLVLQ